MAAVVGLSWANRADGATLTRGGTWETAYPRANLADEELDAVARTTTDAMSATRFAFDLGANYVLRSLALARHNLSATALWRARVGLAERDHAFASGALDDDLLTFGGGANGTCIDSTGAIVASGSGGRLDHDPGTWDQIFKETHLGWLSTTAWVRAGTQGAVGVLDAETLMLSTGGQIRQSHTGVMPSQAYNVSAEIRLLSGSGTLKFLMSDGVTTQQGSTITPTSEWTYYDADFTSGTAGSGVGVAGATAAAGLVGVSGDMVLQVRRMGWKSGAGRTHPGDVLPAHRPNTSTSPICRRFGYLIEPARTQLITRTDDLTSGVASWATSGSITANGASGTLLGQPAFSFTTTATGDLRKSGIAVSSSTTYCAWFLTDNSAAATRVLTFASNSGMTTDTSSTAYTAILISPGVYLCYVIATTSSVQVFARMTMGSTSAQTFKLAAPGLYAANLVPSFIPNTTTGTITRTIDTCTATITALGTRATLFVERRHPTPIVAPSTALANRCGVRNAGSTDQVTLRTVISTGGALQIDAIVDESSTLELNYATAPAGGDVTRAALAVGPSNIRLYVNGAAGDTDAATSMPASMTVLDLAHTVQFPEHIRRVALWRDIALSNADLAAITSLSGQGAGAIGMDTGWRAALEFPFAGDTPTDWGDEHELMAWTDGKFLGRYGTVEIADTNNVDTWVQLARLFVGDVFQPAKGAGYPRWQEGLRDLSTVVMSQSGAKYGTERTPQRTLDFALPQQTQAEANALHELLTREGVLGEVLLIPDPDDVGYSQRYGGLGTMRELAPFEYVTPVVRQTAVRWERKA